jgi:GDPmannose 4,6-dehydratase
VTDPRFVRPAEVDRLIGDASKAKHKLGWTPDVTFEQLVAMMVESDLKRCARS